MVNYTPSPRSSRVAIRTLLSILFITLTGVGLSGCNTTVSLDAGPDANNPGCAAITVRVPDTIDSFHRRYTNAQSTAAWGSPSSILMRCGVTPIGPTTKPCVSVNNIDWVLVSDPEAETAVYITFGRNPATEVIIDHKQGASDAAVLPALAPAIASVERTTQCE